MKATADPPMVSSKSLCQSSVASKPGKALFNHPPLWMNGKADLIRRLTDDFDGDACGVSNTFTGVGRVGERPLDEREAGA